MKELWVWTTTDDTGTEGVAYVELAGGSRVFLVAPDRNGADLFGKLVAQMHQMLGSDARQWTLRHFTKSDVIETVGA